MKERFRKSKIVVLLISALLYTSGCGAGTEEVLNEKIPSEDVQSELERVPTDSAGADTESVQQDSAGADTESVQQDSAGADTESVQQGSAGTDTESVQQGSAEGISGEMSSVSESEEDTHPYDFVLAFAGDISFDENSNVMQQYKDGGNDISKCIDTALIEQMQAADLMWLNNEFTYSTRGTPLEGKAYTFRALPERVNILQELGVDIVGLANNHVYDYGEEAFCDTLTTLQDAGIPYVGAGENLKEAVSPVYFIVDGKKIAYVAASRAEKYKMTPQAAEDEPGILRCYDNELFLEAIREADASADYVIALVHWGTEYSDILEEVQLTTGKEYIDAGADAVIGAHSHCLQGMEYYKGTPIIYSLGNYWFNNKTLDTMLLQLHFYGDDKEQHMDVQVLPAIQQDCVTTAVDGDEAERIFDYLELISINVEIDENGYVLEK